ncbi:MAG: holin [Lachnospiraceae bacterium]|nr:holin [Lachnospiraceae bacterium]
MKKRVKHWIGAAGIRAVKTMAQTAIATIGTSVLLDDVDWIRLVSTVTLAGLLSVLTSLAGLPELQMK